MTRFRNNPPPFEVMKGGPPIRSTGTGPSEPVAEPLPSASSGKHDSWWARVQQPMVVRLPSGLAVVLIGAFLSVIVLAYWVGQTRGHRQAEKQLQADHTASQGASATIANGQSAALPFLNNRVSEAGLVRSRSESARSGEREVGLNYFILAHYPEADARRLVEFLRETGVEVAAYRAHNKRFFQVVALHGFAKDDLYSQQRKAFEEQLRQLGRAWKEQRQGPDFAKSGIYLDLYEGESAVKTIQ